MKKITHFENFIRDEINIALDSSRLEKRFLDEISVFNEESQKIILDSLEFARQKHNGAYRAENTPYITHPILVATYCIRFGGKFEDICACILHDVLEDTDTSKSRILQRYGEKILLKVDALSKTADGKNKDIKEYVLAIASDSEHTRNKCCDIFANSYGSYFYADPEIKKRHIDKMKMDYQPIIQNLKFFYPEFYKMIIQAMDFAMKNAVSQDIQSLISKLGQQKI